MLAAQKHFSFFERGSPKSFRSSLKIAEGQRAIKDAPKCILRLDEHKSCLTSVPDYADPVRHIQPHQMDDADHFLSEKAHTTPLLTTACAIYFSTDVAIIFNLISP